MKKDMNYNSRFKSICGTEDVDGFWDKGRDDYPGDDDLPGLELMSDVLDAPPDLPPGLIGCVLRQGHKMLVSGSSKAGKSFLLLELAVAISEGRSWLGFPCRRGRVLYVNLEIDPDSCMERIRMIYRALEIEPEHADDLAVWNLRGCAQPLDELLPNLYRRMWGEGFSAVIIDPIYKVTGGDENSATDMGYFCNQLDRICRNTGASVIFCHHHSKGAQGAKRSLDRSSGSGVFARDPDAVLDLIRLELPPDLQSVAGNCGSAWRLEGTLREFPSFRPVDLWFRYPIHTVDLEGVLADAEPEGSAGSNLFKSSKRTSEKGRKNRLDKAYDAICEGHPVKLRDMAEQMGVSQATVRTYLKDYADEYWCESGLVVRRNRSGDAEGERTS